MPAHAPIVRERPIARERPKARADVSDPLDFFRGLALAIPLSLLLWAAIVRVAWSLWRG
jgi:hypothetical protein